MKNKNNVYKTYNKIANWYDEHRSRNLFEKPWLDKALALLPLKGEILDLGCGTGQPMIPYFVKNGFEITGVEASKKMLDIAKAYDIKAKLVCADMRTINLDKKFDCIIAWHSFFHLPQSDQRLMFDIFVKHLKRRGVLLFTTGWEDGEIWGDNGGQMLYHASLEPNEYRHLLTTHGFELLEHKVSDPACGDATIWLARLK